MEAFCACDGMRGYGNHPQMVMLTARGSAKRVFLCCSIGLLVGGSGCTRLVEDVSAEDTASKTEEASTQTTTVEGSTDLGSATDSSQAKEAEKGESPQTEENQTGTQQATSTGVSTGVQTSASSSSSQSTTSTSDPSVCNEGDERACSELPDGTKVEFPGGEPQGSCVRGVAKCEKGQWGACVGTVGPKEKDTCEAGNDANCNGKPTDHCACQAGDKAPCGEDEGACEKGEMTCGADGTWGECLGSKGPTAELCDGRGIDEDCNGKADIADPKCDCIDQTARACRLAGLGDCAQGGQRCVGGAWSWCEVRFRKSVESCGRQSDGKEAQFGTASGDEDCDGRVDESDFTNPRPQGCRIAFEDKDRDGFGAMGPSIAEDMKQATHGCLCEAAPLPQYWRWDTGNRANTDCGDCIADGREVNPLSRHTDTQPSSCLVRLKYSLPFDYNCSGVEEPKFTEQFRCEVRAGGGGCESFGKWWTGDKYPACGESGAVYTPQDCIYDEGPNTCRVTMMGATLRETQECG